MIYEEAVALTIITTVIEGQRIRTMPVKPTAASQRVAALTEQRRREIAPY